MQSSLLSDNYPSGAYEKYQRENYGLCWKCHDSALVEASQTTTATKFRNGDVNLHQVHVQKFKRGRACHLCHTPPCGGAATPPQGDDQVRLLGREVRFPANSRWG
jgi:hypothetical protein